jgi:parallel beta-helix repeat protein
MIGFSTSAGNGNPLTYYRVSTVSASTIVLTSKVYLGESTATLIEAGCKRVVPVSTGLSTAQIGNITKAITVEGGYTYANNTSPVRDSETWLRHAFTESGTTNLGFSLSNAAILKYMNVGFCYHNFLPAGVGCDLSFCTGYTSFYRSLATNSSTAVLNNLLLNAPIGATSFDTIHLTAPITFGSNVYGISASAASAFNYTVTGTCSGGYARCSYNGFSAAIASLTITNADANFISNIGLNTASASNVLIQNSVVKNSVIGINMGATAYDNEINNNNVSLCSTYGIYMTQSHGVNIRENTLSSNGYNVGSDQYCGNITLYNNTHLTPTTAALYKIGLNSGAWTVIGDTIDEASRFKALIISASSSNLNNPQYKLQNAFGRSGHYFANHQIIRQSGASPSIDFQFNTLISNIKFGYKITSVFVKAGIAKDFTFELNTSAAIASVNIVPRFRLNGYLIQTEAAITSVSTGSTWDSYTVNIPDVSIDEDGELELEFVLNSGAGVVRLRVTSVVDA